jgi:hypothetical protein
VTDFVGGKIPGLRLGERPVSYCFPSGPYGRAMLALRPCGADAIVAL